MGWISGLNTITLKLAWRLPDNDGNDDKCIVSVSRAITDARMIMDDHGYVLHGSYVVDGTSFPHKVGDCLQQ